MLMSRYGIALYTVAIVILRSSTTTTVIADSNTVQASATAIRNDTNPQFRHHRKSGIIGNQKHRKSRHRCRSASFSRSPS
ncbi:hypothetical protein L2E82_51608 [Cichorium intybus]|nr:hypothetical protein L2E82_51608 [Cichorium intybus]